MPMVAHSSKTLIAAHLLQPPPDMVNDFFCRPCIFRRCRLVPVRPPAGHRFAVLAVRETSGWNGGIFRDCLQCVGHVDFKGPVVNIPLDDSREKGQNGPCSQAGALAEGA